MRKTLGEKWALIQQSYKRLEGVTTPSLHALQLHSKADELMRAPADNEVALAHQQLQEVENAQKPPFSSPDLFFPLAFGELAEAERRTRRGDPQYRIVDLGLVELPKGDLRTAKKNFAATKKDMFSADATGTVWLGRCGQWEKVDRIIRKSP